jgi:hypothetical protein
VRDAFLYNFLKVIPFDSFFTSRYMHRPIWSSSSVCYWTETAVLSFSRCLSVFLYGPITVGLAWHASVFRLVAECPGNTASVPTAGVNVFLASGTGMTLPYFCRLHIPRRTHYRLRIKIFHKETPSIFVCLTLPAHLQLVLRSRKPGPVLPPSSDVSMA